MKVFLFSLIFILTSLSTFGTTIVTSGDGHHREPGCPFMAHEQAICDMNAFDHIAAWQKVFTTILPTLSLYAFLAALVFLSQKYWKPLYIFVQTSRRGHSQDVIVFSLYQQLFSDGLLNPKAP